MCNFFNNNFRFWFSGRGTRRSPPARALKTDNSARPSERKEIKFSPQFFLLPGRGEGESAAVYISFYQSASNVGAVVNNEKDNFCCAAKLTLHKPHNDFPSIARPFFAPRQKASLLSRFSLRRSIIGPACAPPIGLLRREVLIFCPIDRSTPTNFI